MGDHRLDRRRFLQHSAAGAAALLAGPQGSDVFAADAPRPNIAVVLLDDMGFSDLHCYGGEIDTPHIDRMAREGLRFTQFYNTAKCGPTRMSLLTGLYYPRANRDLSGGVCMADVLRRAGYFTAATGKWHLDGPPTTHGFDRYFGHMSGRTNYWTGDDTFRLNGEKWDDFPDDFYTTDADTDYAVRFLKEAQAEDKPFFLYLAYNAPHSPLQAPKENVVKYHDTYRAGWDRIRHERYRRIMDMGLLKNDWDLPPRPDYIPAWDSLSKKEQDWEARRMAAYAGMIDRVDQNIGRLVRYLKSIGEYDNTLFLLLSDNGASPFQRTEDRSGHPWEADTLWWQGTSWANVSNTPFRWYKQNQHEGGISTPLIAHWPNGLGAEPGSVTHQPGHLIDIMPTALDVSGATYPERHEGHDVTPCQGRSLLPILRGKRRKGHEALFFVYADNRAIRRGKWKLASVRGGPWELYNLDEDRTETNDLSDEKPRVAEELKAKWYSMAKNDIQLWKGWRQRPVEGEREEWDGHPSHVRD